ncbi:Guanine nucleotide-binding protein G(s) subunit alpha [Hypsibius exemplaris]|uniref:Guanine nucleotide-binding protein G(s) subunit alpha n=1 Tax=Hypsibius exemplaris TaxID=2072580 RepID=A0A1W0WSN3_HYPEX|nr:Guanine nucleotide-binding protein G(s) subunit alpha [Hypsibius exemplaris]
MAKSGKNWKEMCKKVFNKDQELEREQNDFQKTYRLLVLGTKESGKTTMMKQMRILYGAGYTERDRKYFIQDIRLNLKESIQKLVEALKTLEPQIELERSRNQSHVAVVMRSPVPHTNGSFTVEPPRESPSHSAEVHHVVDKDAFPEEFWDSTEILWIDAGIQTAYRRRAEFQLPDNSKYFLDRTSEIRRPDYVPSEQDVLRVRIQSSKSMETIFTVDNVRYNMFDVAGQRDQRGKWLQCFNNITAIFFVVPASGYNLVLQDSEEGTNRLAESFHVFNMLWNSKWLTRKSVILFLNKMDQLREKISSGQAGLELFFPEFQAYTTPSYASSGSTDDPEFIRAKYFIRNEIMKITTASNTQHVCYPHFTSAIDTENSEGLRWVPRDHSEIKIQQATLCDA